MPVKAENTVKAENIITMEGKNESGDAIEAAVSTNSKDGTDKSLNDDEEKGGNSCIQGIDDQNQEKEIPDLQNDSEVDEAFSKLVTMNNPPPQQYYQEGSSLDNSISCAPSTTSHRNTSNILSTVSLEDLDQGIQEEQATRKIPIAPSTTELISNSNVPLPQATQQPQQRHPVGLIRNNQLQRSTLTALGGDDVLAKNNQTEGIPLQRDDAIKEAEKLRMSQTDSDDIKEKIKNDAHQSQSGENSSKSKLRKDKNLNEEALSKAQDKEDKKIKNKLQSERGKETSKPGAFAVTPNKNSTGPQMDDLTRKNFSSLEAKEKMKNKSFSSPANDGDKTSHDYAKSNDKYMKKDAKYLRGKAEAKPGAVFVPHAVDDTPLSTDTAENEIGPHTTSLAREGSSVRPLTLPSVMEHEVSTDHDRISGGDHDVDEDEALAAAIAASNEEAAAIAQEELDEQERIRERERREAGKREFSNQHNQAALRTHPNPGVVIAPSDPFANALRQSSTNTICININTTNQLRKEQEESSIDNSHATNNNIPSDVEGQNVPSSNDAVDTSDNHLNVSNTTMEENNNRLGVVPSPAPVVPFSQEEHYDPETPIIDAHVERAPEASIEEGIPHKEQLRQKRHEKRQHFMEKFIRFRTPNTHERKDDDHLHSSKEEHDFTTVKSVEFFRGACICHQRVCIVLSILALVVIIVVAIVVAIVVPLTKKQPGNDPARFDSISNIVSSSNVSLESNLNTAGSPQFKALEWLAWYDPLQVSTTNTEQILRRYALVVFYFSLSGDNWENKFFFLGGDHECRWHDDWDTEDNMFHGVTCNEQNEVIFLDFYKNNLKGTIPWKEVTSLTSLERLHLNNNDIVGSISSDALPALPHLKRMKLAFNTFTGNIPVEMGELKSLEILDLRGTKQLIGTLPPSLGALTNLTVLSVADNLLTGTVPQTYANLASLEQFWIYSNQITGSVDFLCDTVQGGGPNIAADCEFNDVICSCNCTCFS